MKLFGNSWSVLALIGFAVVSTGVAEMSPELDAVFQQRLEGVRTEVRPRIDQFNYGFQLRYVNDRYICVDNTGRHGYNTVVAGDVARSGQGECADLRRADFTNGILMGASLGGANCFGAKFVHASMQGTELMGAVLVGSDMNRADMTSENMYGANAAGANLTKASLFTADLERADFSGASLAGVYAVYGDFKDANLSKVNLRGANLQGAVLDGADLAGAVYDDTTVLPFDPATAAQRGMIHAQ